MNMSTNSSQPYSVLELIPQRPPIVMIDSFHGIDAAGVASSSLTIDDKNIFVDNNRLQEPGIVEHIAQTAAARAGYLFKINDQPVVLGYIGSVDKLTIARLPEVGERLTTSITVVSEVMDIVMIAAEVVGDKGEVAACRMKIFLKK